MHTHTNVHTHQHTRLYKYTCMHSSPFLFQLSDHKALKLEVEICMCLFVCGCMVEGVWAFFPLKSASCFQRSQRLIVRIHIINQNHIDSFIAWRNYTFKLYLRFNFFPHLLWKNVMPVFTSGGGFSELKALFLSSYPFSNSKEGLLCKSFSRLWCLSIIDG